MMATQATNILEAKQLGIRRTEKATVQSLVRLQSPPDTLQLISALQTTLDLEELLGLFMHEASQHLPLDGIAFRSAEQGIVLQLAAQGRHRVGYGLRLLDESLGEITFCRGRPFSEEELAIVEHLLVPLLYPLRNGLRYHTALATAFRDPLTGVNNRAAMEEAMPREVGLALRHKMALSMLIIDLDHFKKINDGYGHAAGDCVLRSAAKLMQQALRTSDEMFRFGGEEFVIMLPATDIDGAMIVAERIRSAIASHPCVCGDDEITVTASIGVAKLDETDNQHSLFDKADTAVYRAKALGRNQVIRYEE